MMRKYLKLILEKDEVGGDDVAKSKLRQNPVAKTKAKINKKTTKTKRKMKNKT